MTAKPTLICPKNGQTHAAAAFDGDLIDWGADNQGYLQSISAAVFRAWWLNAKELTLTFSRTTATTSLNGTATFVRSNGQIAGATETAWAKNYPPPSIDASFGNGVFQPLDMGGDIGWIQTSGSGTYDSGGGPVAATVSDFCPTPQVMARPRDSIYRASLYRYTASVTSGPVISVNSSASAQLGSNTSSETYSLTTTRFVFNHTDTGGTTHNVQVDITDTFYP